jgi:hypothetical protein
LEQLTVASEASVTVSGTRNGNVKVPLNSNQVKSLQAGVHADGGGLYLVVRESGDRVWAFRFTDVDGKRARMEFGRVRDCDSAAGDPSPESAFTGSPAFAGDDAQRMERRLSAR